MVRSEIHPRKGVILSREHSLTVSRIHFAPYPATPTIGRSAVHMVHRVDPVHRAPPRAAHPGFGRRSACWWGCGPFEWRNLRNPDRR